MTAVISKPMGMHSAEVASVRLAMRPLLSPACCQAPFIHNMKTANENHLWCSLAPGKHIHGMMRKPTAGVRRQPRRKPSRLRNRTTVLIRWNWTEASCIRQRWVNCRNHCGKFNASMQQVYAGAAASHPVRLWAEQACHHEVQKERYGPRGHLRR